MTYALAADYYDLLYAFKDYASEARRIRDLVESRRPGARTLLDVACGTGQHLARLREWYDVAGVDAEPRLLDVARRRLTGVPLHVGDMRDFQLGQTFDAVTCLFSAIGYMSDLADLRRALATVAAHTAPGGVVLVEPWLSPEEFDADHLARPLVGEGDGVRVVRMNGSRRDGRLAVMDFHYLVARPGEVDHLVEMHVTALFTAHEYRSAFEAAGLRVEHDSEGLIGRGLWIGKKA